MKYKVASEILTVMLAAILFYFIPEQLNMVQTVGYMCLYYIFFRIALHCLAVVTDWIRKDQRAERKLQMFGLRKEAA